jgi:hypothetical protein
MRGQGWRPMLGQAGFLSQRAWGILMVLCVLMAVPYWMAKKAGNKTAAEVKVASGKKPAATSSTPGSTPDKAPDTATASAPAPGLASAVVAVNPDRFGLTFGHGALPSPQSGLMVSACAGTPLDMGNPDKNQCNPTQGDTSCRTALPVLCALKDGSTAESAGLTNEPKPEGSAAGPTLYAGWMGGSLAATAPVAGFVIGSRAQANARCASELGTGWRMAELHDAGAGWGLVGKRGQGLVNTNTRHWVAVNDQKSNCWDPS